MGMNADIIGFGPFAKEIVGALDYAPCFYTDVNDCAMVVVTAFIAETSASSRQLAEAVGVDPWNFNTHKIDPEKVDYGQLHDFLEHHHEIAFGGWHASTEEEYKKDRVANFKLLINRGFIFFFRPNG